MKFFSLLQLKTGQRIDEFRKRVNRRNLSFSQFILMIRKTIILQKLQEIVVFSETTNDADSQSFIGGTNDSLTTVPTTPDSLQITTTSTVPQRIRTRQGLQTHFVNVIRPGAQPLRTTPFRFNSTSVVKRLHSCTLQMGLYTVPENG